MFSEFSWGEKDPNSFDFLVKELVTFFGSESGAVSESLREDSSNLLQLIRQAYEVSSAQLSFYNYVAEKNISASPIAMKNWCTCPFFFPENC